MSGSIGGSKILIVDDDAVSRELCREVIAPLLRPGITVDEARSGEEALVKIRGAAYDAVIADYRMGLMNGIDLLELALQDSPHTLRILMTGARDLALAQEALTRARIQGFVLKGAPVLEMRASFGTILQRRHR